MPVHPDHPHASATIVPTFHAHWVADFRYGIILGLVAFALGGVTPIAAQVAPRKVALIVAIGKYPEPSLYGYPQINAGNDAPLIAQALERQGFQPKDIRVLLDEQATRQGILDAFRTTLLDSAGPGDIIAFHYSGHGHQLTDDNGDELDGYDEVLVPYGAPNPEGRDFPANYTGGQHIRDDLLNDLLTQLRAKVGPTGYLVVTIDACFSGSATRGRFELPVRGIATPIGKPASTRGVSGAIFEDARTSVRGGAGTTLAPMVVISATDHDQLDHEVWGPGRLPVGPLSLAISQTLPNLTPRMSGAAWFEQIRLAMAGTVPYQSPQVEGAVDVELFSGRIADSDRYLRVTSVVGDSVAVLEGGTLIGVQQGARVAFYALNAVAGAPPVRTGVVHRADELSADVLLTLPDINGEIQASRALLTESSYGTLEIRVAVDTLPDPDVRTVLLDALRPVANVRLVSEQPDLVVTAGATGQGLFLRAAANNVALAGPFDPTLDADRKELVRGLRAYARNRFLTQIEMRDPAIDVRLEIVPVTHQITSRGCVSSDTTRSNARRTASGWVFHKDDGFLLRLRNVGHDPAYVAVLELSQTGLTQLFPNAALRVSDNRLEPGETFLVQDLCFAADEPFGDYVFKLFATRDHIDFTPVVAADGAVRGGAALNYFEQLMADAYRGTRSGVTGRAAGTGSTHATTMRVVPGLAPQGRRQP